MKRVNGKTQTRSWHLERKNTTCGRNEIKPRANETAAEAPSATRGIKRGGQTDQELQNSWSTPEEEGPGRAPQGRSEQMFPLVFFLEGYIIIEN